MDLTAPVPTQNVTAREPSLAARCLTGFLGPLGWSRTLVRLESRLVAEPGSAGGHVAEAAVTLRLCLGPRERPLAVQEDVGHARSGEQATAAEALAEAEEAALERAFARCLALVEQGFGLSEPPGARAPRAPGRPAAAAPPAPAPLAAAPQPYDDPDPRDLVDFAEVPPAAPAPAAPPPPAPAAAAAPSAADLVRAEDAYRHERERELRLAFEAAGFDPPLALALAAQDPERPVARSLRNQLWKTAKQLKGPSGADALWSEVGLERGAALPSGAQAQRYALLLGRRRPLAAAGAGLPGGGPAPEAPPCTGASPCGECQAAA